MPQRQSGGNLYGLHDSIRLSTPLLAYGGDAIPLRTRRGTRWWGCKPGGWSRAGGGLPLYSETGSLLGALGISGDTSCADHIVGLEGARYAAASITFPLG